MNTKDIFPKRYYASERYGFIQNIPLAEKIWKRINKELVWYATDLEITSPTSVRLFVYDMADSYVGGIGKIILNQHITNLKASEQQILNELLLLYYDMLAYQEFESQEAEKNRKKVLKIRKKMFNI